MDIKNMKLDEKTLVSIEDHNGVKYIHYLGYGYYAGTPEDKPYRWIEYSGLICTVQEASASSASRWEREHQESTKQYIEDLSQDEIDARYVDITVIYDHDISDALPCGEYYLFVGDGVNDLS